MNCAGRGFGGYIGDHTSLTERPIHQRQVPPPLGTLRVTEEMVDLPMVARELLNPAKEWEGARETAMSCYIEQRRSDTIHAVEDEAGLWGGERKYKPSSFLAHSSHFISFFSTSSMSRFT